jgi:hypothetical protein
LDSNSNIKYSNRKYVCVRITNQAEAVIPYTITSTVTNDVDNLCANAFGLPKEILGTVDANAVKTDGALVQVANDATPISGCNVVITVARG